MNRLKNMVLQQGVYRKQKLNIICGKFIINELKSKTQTELANEIGCSCSLASNT